ncbi:peptide deformylase [bacterium]|nr:peptide deformylase [bacterium]
MVLPITFAGNPILYKKTKEIPVKDIKSAKIQTFLNNLGETVTHYTRAAGLAAPQVGRDFRVFCLKLDKKSLNYDVIFPKNFEIPASKPFFFINPVLQVIDGATEEMGEGCLSIPFYHVFVERYLKIKVSAYTSDGEKFEIIAKGMYARYIQHEVDHLNGILIFQRAKKPEDIVFDGESNLDE